jgi:type I restriction enzyme S subunit
MVARQRLKEKPRETGVGWPKKQLGELIHIKHGYAFKGEYFSSSGPFVVLTPGNFFDQGGFKDKAEKEKHYTSEVPNDFILKKGDLLVAMTEQAEGLLGSSAIVPASDYYLHNQRLGLVTAKDPAQTDRIFLYYLFNTPHVRQRIRASASGTKVRHTSPSRIYEVVVAVPSFAMQRQVAEILSAYDDLIRNNARRIKILEEMSRSLYREWFVDFRFPGHERVKLVDATIGNIPEGWKAGNLGERALEMRRSVSPKQIDPKTPYFGLEHLPRKSIALSEWGTVQEVQSTKLGFKKGEILFGKIRPYFHKVGVAPLDGVCSSDAIVIAAERRDFFPLVLCCVSSEEFVAHATQTSQGTKMPRANWDVLKKYPVAIPPSPLLEKFNRFVEESVAEIQNLIFKNRNLRSTRDLLLPKLVLGEIELR